MPQTIESKISRMSPRNVIQGIILFKPNPPTFYKERLEKGIKKAFGKYPDLIKLFENYSVCDGTSPTEQSTAFEDSLSLLERCYFIYEDPAFLHLSYFHIRESSRKLSRNLLEREFGAEALRELKDLAKLVWAK